MLNWFLIQNPWHVIAVSGGVSSIFLLLTLVVRDPKEPTKWVLFSGISFPVLIASVFLITSTVYLNLVSVTKGPVHWHADIVIYNCGEDVDLKNPEGLSNRIGTPLLHEHGDKRIHVEGVVARWEDVTLGAFFDAIGGYWNDTHIAFPTNDRDLLILTDGERCPNGVPASIQTFVWTIEESVAVQKKLPQGRDHILTPDAQVPPGDCIVIEYGTPNARTEHICRSYLVAEQNGRITIER